MIVLDEASGPVSPRFQYSVSVTIADGVARVRSKGGELGTHDVEVPIDEAALVTALAGAPLLVDLVDESRARRVGVRVNVLEIDGKKVRYLRSDLDDPSGAALRCARGLVLDAVRRALLPDEG